jgi:hypothetical protein
MSLNASELAGMRDAIELLLPDTCNVCTITNTADAQGGVTKTRGTSGTSIPCRLDVITGREQLAGGAVAPFVSYKMSMLYDTVVNHSDIIEHNGVDYYVTGVNLAQSWKAVVRVDLERG